MDDFITTREAAAMLGVTARRVLALIAEGRLPSRVVNSRLHLIARADLNLVKNRPNGRPKKSHAKEQPDARPSSGPVAPADGKR